MDIKRVNYKTPKGEFEGYFVKIGKGKYVRITIGDGEITEIPDKDIISLVDVRINLLAQVEETKDI